MARRSSHTLGSRLRHRRPGRPGTSRLTAAAVGFAVATSASGASADNYSITVDASKTASGLPHFWSTCVGTGTASLTLRADLQTHYKLANRELGMQRVRGHGALNDLGIYLGPSSYDWTNFDTYLKAIAAANMRPLMELSFNPASLGSNGTNSPPTDYAVYQQYIKDVVQRAVTDMGTTDVSQWYWEVWNEPNFSGFWTGTFDDYLTLYAHAVAGATAVLPNILIGGPVTTSGSSAQIQQFLSYAKTNNLRVAFASSHAYASGGTGNVADSNFAVGDNNTRVSDIESSGLPNLVSINSEWSSSYSGQGGGTADTVVSMDNHWNAPFIVKTVKLLADQIQGNTPPLEIFSYWTVSDIFNEGYWVPDHNNIPFSAIFGLMNFQGVRKASWNAFRMLNYMGANRLTATGGTGTMDGVDAFAAESVAGDEVEIIVYNYYGTVAMSSVSGSDTVALTVNDLPFTGPSYVTQFPVDSGHANPYGVWVGQGQPVTPTEAQWEAMRSAQHLVPTQMPTPTSLNGSYTGTLTIPKQGAVLVTIGRSRPVIGRNAFVTTEGEDYDGQSAVTKEDSNDTSMGQAILGSSGGYAYYEDMDFADGGVDAVQLRVNAQSATSLELRADTQTGTLIGTCPIAATGGSYSTQTCALMHTSGVHKLYINFAGAVHLNSFIFTGPGAPDAGTPTQMDGGASSGPSGGSSSGSTVSGTGSSQGATGANGGTSSRGATGGAGASTGTSTGSAGSGSANSGCGCAIVDGRGAGGSLAVGAIGLCAVRRRRRRSDPRQ
jgi:xylan 1,4-beta-xylosidase